MYGMQDKVTAMDWVDNGKSVCVGTSSGSKHEILELSLPDKLLTTEEEGSHAKLCVEMPRGEYNSIPPIGVHCGRTFVFREHHLAVIKGRDFNVKNGGFCQGEITNIKHIPGTRLCLVVEKSSSTVTAWKMGDNESDMIQKQKEIQGLKSCCSILDRVVALVEQIHVLKMETWNVACNQHSPRTIQKTYSDGICPRLKVCIDGQDTTKNFAYGTRTNDISVVDLATFQTVKDTTDLTLSQEVCYLSFLEHSTILCCCRNSGDLFILDLRDKKVKVTHSPCLGRQAAFWTAIKSGDGCATSQGKTLFIQLSSEGQFIILDPRQISECISETTMQKGAKTNNEYINLQVSTCQKYVSTSGFDGEVDVFCFDSLKSSVENIVEPVFTHEGHVTTCEEPITSDFTVTAHLQHPVQPSLILSAASDGSLHAWEYIMK